jgi:phytol kinase
MSTVPPTTPAVGIAIVVGLSLSVLLGVRHLQRRAALHPELARKLAHIGSGLIAMSLPFWFDRLWPVLVVVGVAVATLVGSRWRPAWREQVAGALDGVERTTLGDTYFPLAVAALYAVAPSLPLYLAPLAMLTFGDAAAALVGVRYGRWRFRSPDGEKSGEGSIACAIASFLAVHIILLLGTSVGRAESLLIAAIAAILVTLLEAVSWAGLDNLLIPIGGFALLSALLPLSPSTLLAALVVAVVLLTLALALRRRRSLSDSALAAGVLLGTACWGLGGLRWLVPPMTLFLSYALLWPKRRQLVRRPHDLEALVAVCSTGAVWLLAEQQWSRPSWYFAFTLAFAVQGVAIGISWGRDRRGYQGDSRVNVRADVPAILLSSLECGALFGIPYALLMARTTGLVVQLAMMLPILVVGGLLYAVLVRPDPTRPTSEFPWSRQVLSALAASSLGLLAAA